MRTAAVLLLLSALSIAPVSAQSTPGNPAPSAAPSAPSQGTAQQGAGAAKLAPATGPDLSAPVDTADHWTVGFTVFAAENLSAQNAYLASSIPLLLRDEVSGLARHAFSPEDRDAVRGVIAQKALDAADQAVTAVRKEHDALLFSVTEPTAAAKKAAEDKLGFALARREFLRSLDKTLIVLAEDKPVTLAVGKDQGKLLDAPLIPAASYCARQNLDLLVGGTISEVQGYLLVDVWAFDAARGELVVSARDAARREELYGDLAETGAVLTGAILGRDWSMLTFAPQPPESSLYVDGVLAAAGAAPSLYLDPGAREIRVSAPGYVDVTRTLTLVKGATTAINDSLLLTQPGTVSITTDPAGAVLYVDSRWQGVTPLTIERPSQRSRGVLDLVGYYPVALDLGPGTPGAMSVTMPKDVGPRDVLQGQAQDRFYASFAWFVLSLPIPLFSYGLVFDFGVQNQDFLRAGQLVQAAKALSTSRAFLVGYYGGAALSAALFTWMVVRIVQYVAVANGIAG